MPAIKIRALTKFPSRVLATAGLQVAKANGIWTLELDLATLQALGSVPAGDLDNVFAVVYNSDNGTNARVPLDVLASAVSSGLDATLVAIAGLSPTANQLIYWTGADTASLATLTAAGRALLDDTDAAAQLATLGVSAFVQTLLDDADASAVRTTLGLVIGTNVQAFDAELAAIAGLTSAADKVPYFTGAGTASTADFTASGRSMVAAASAAAQTALLSAFTGDSGAGGVKGLVPAPASGDAAASKFLKADGTWVAPAGSGTIGGTTGGSDNRVIRSDGTGGSTIQNSNVTIDDTGNVTGVVALTASGAVSGGTVAGSMIATQAQMEAGTATDVIVTPGRQHFHPAEAKAWAYVTISAGSPTLAAGYNVDSGITDNGAGDFTVSWTTDLSSGNYASLMLPRTAGGASASTCFLSNTASSKLAGSERFLIEATNGGDFDPVAFSVVVFGDI